MEVKKKDDCLCKIILKIRSKEELKKITKQIPSK